MNENEILDYYNENWNDYNKIVDMLHEIIDQHEDEIKKLKVQNQNLSQVDALKTQLQECQDKLDEETHKL